MTGIANSGTLNSMVAHTRSSQEYINQHTSMNTGNVDMAPTLVEELQEIDGYKGREHHFASVMNPLISCPCLSGQPYTYVHADNTAWTH